MYFVNGTPYGEFQNGGLSTLTTLPIFTNVYVEPLNTPYGSPASNQCVTTLEITISALDINSDLMTVVMWIYPNENQTNTVGLLYCLGTEAGFGFRGNSAGDLSYNWGNAAATYWYATAFAPIVTNWSMVAYVLTPEQHRVLLLQYQPGELLDNKYRQSSCGMERPGCHRQQPGPGEWPGPVRRRYQRVWRYSTRLSIAIKLTIFPALTVQAMRKMESLRLFIVSVAVAVLVLFLVRRCEYRPRREGGRQRLFRPDAARRFSIWKAASLPR